MALPDNGSLALAGGHGGWVNQYQTLITGLAAVVAAFLTIRSMSAAIEQTAALDREHRLRDLASARAVLPLALSEMCDYARSCGRILKILLDAEFPPAGFRRRAHGLRGTGATAGSCRIFRDCVRSSEPPHAQAIADILKMVQLQNVQLQNLHPENSHARHLVCEIVLNTAELYARTTALFGFAKGRTRRPPAATQPKAMRMALRFVGFHGHNEIDAILTERMAAK